MKANTLLNFFLILVVFSFIILFQKMENSQASSDKATSFWKASLHFALGWFIPGLGHVVLKKYWRGAIFFVCITSMALLGLLMGGKIYPFQTENPLTILAHFADLGFGFLYGLYSIFSFGKGILEKVTFEFGTAYLAGAGLLNYLVALDAFDIAMGKKK